MFLTIVEGYQPIKKKKIEGVSQKLSEIFNLLFEKSGSPLVKSVQATDLFYLFKHIKLSL